MQVFITGGTGFVGTALTRRLAREGHEVLLLTRSARGRSSDESGLRLIEGDPTQAGPWQEAAGAADVVINLAGATIFTRWTSAAKRRIVDSRILTTRRVVEALATGVTKPRVLVSASAVGHYGARGEETVDESAGPGEGFLARLCQDWEGEAEAAKGSGARVVLSRFGIVLGPGGGALGIMLPLYRWGLGGRLGNGRQGFSWIHLSDLVAAALFCLNHADIAGPVNVTSPNPVSNAELNRALGRVLRRPSILPAPVFLVRLILGEFGAELLTGQRVLPARLLAAGFIHKYPQIESALAQILT